MPQVTNPDTGITYPSACHLWNRADHQLSYVNAARRVFAAAIDALASDPELADAVAELRSEWEYLNRSHDHRLSALRYCETNATEWEQQKAAALAEPPSILRGLDAARAMNRALAYRDAARVLGDDVLTG